MKTKICILIRVYDRIEDLKYCLEIIKKTWLSFDYFIMVVSNGIQNGFNIDLQLKSKIDLLIELDSNAGHLKGNAQLLQEGLPKIPKDSLYTIILEADTWIYGDAIIKKYVGKLGQGNEVWASANWYSHLYSLATDFAILKTDFLINNPEIFDYTGFPECYAANYMLENNFQFLYIKENMPVHLPSYIKNYPFASGIRFNVFPESKMVTHHVEQLKGGMLKKKQLFNTLVKAPFFEDTAFNGGFIDRMKIRTIISLSKLFPSKGWVGVRKANILPNKLNAKHNLI